MAEKASMAGHEQPHRQRQQHCHQPSITTTTRIIIACFQRLRNRCFIADAVLAGSSVFLLPFAASGAGQVAGCKRHSAHFSIGVAFFSRIAGRLTHTSLLGWQRPLPVLQHHCQPLPRCHKAHKQKKPQEPPRAPASEAWAPPPPVVLTSLPASSSGNGRRRPIQEPVTRSLHITVEASISFRFHPPLPAHASPLFLNPFFSLLPSLCLLHSSLRHWCSLIFAELSVLPFSFPSTSPSRHRSPSVSTSSRFSFLSTAPISSPFWELSSVFSTSTTSFPLIFLHLPIRS
ncbi:hypothetical protein VTN96DRAFT_1514 [Rasamsonia emersonii]